MKIATFSRIDDLDPKQWNALVRGRYPFLQHEFLSAMERHNCVGEHAGWIPRHLGYFEGDILRGAMPLYEKHNSWGEFVFDHAWADAFHRAGIRYYPKLVNAIPFTPASGQRLLTTTTNHKAIVRALHQGSRDLMQYGEFSGLHCLFMADHEYELLQNGDGEAVSRSDCQFHWHNRDYRDFEDFLATLKAKKRKNIRQERARVAHSGVRIRRLNGHTAKAADWHDFNHMYHAIYQRKYGAPAFNLNFFSEIASLIPEQIQLVMAYRDHEAVAAALMYLDDHTLYGRHWGCREYLDCLHFELCYYQGIEICIELGLQHFNSGAQGEHKIARGFMPTRTKSLHWMAHNPFASAIKQFSNRETSGITNYIKSIERHSPYQHDSLSGQER